MKETASERDAGPASTLGQGGPSIFAKSAKKQSRGDSLGLMMAWMAMFSGRNRRKTAFAPAPAI